MLKKRLQKLLARPDIKTNFLAAIFKRLLWRLRWFVTKKPYVISFAENLEITLPKTGSASLIYYQGVSEPKTADFVQRFLDEGMTVVDVGAHLGEYTLLAAETVGTSGEVHAFEPQGKMFPFLQQNIQLNQLDWVTINRVAVSDHLGEIEFAVFDEPSVSSICQKEVTAEAAKLVKVATTSLDSYWRDRTKKIDLIKVDVEGAEKLVFEGAKTLLQSSPTEAPTWIFEYAPQSYAKFDYQAKDLLNLLRSYGYQILRYLGEGKIIDFSFQQPRSGIINLVATKEKEHLLSLIQNN